MKKTVKGSWFEVIPANDINDNLEKGDKKVTLVQIESTNVISQDGFLLMLCEVIYDE